MPTTPSRACVSPQRSASSNVVVGRCYMGYKFSLWQESDRYLATRNVFAFCEARPCSDSA
eukprot:2558194-Pleurochrysis_carterae.AAC.6